uniref:Uncharacterized protein n=1 Tax=Arundo donax TaxID=35708 RepID=A0A0A9ECD2_ARUDO
MSYLRLAVACKKIMTDSMLTSSSTCKELK